MKPVNRSQFHLAEQVRNRFAVTLEPGVELDDFLKEEATQHIASHLRRGDILEVCPEDQAWHADVKVKDAGKNYAKFNVISFVRWAQKEEKQEPVAAAPSTDLRPPAPQSPAADGSGDASAYAVKWGGPSQQFRVIRKADNEVMQSGFADKEVAAAWIAEHEKA